MEFRILGPLEVVEGDRQISLGGRKPRALLAMLILRRGQIVSVDELVEALWGDDQPKTAEHSVQVYVSELRKALGDAADASTVVEHRDPGYALDVPDAEIDLHRFEGLADTDHAGRSARIEDFLKKHGRPTSLKDALRQSTRQLPANDSPGPRTRKAR